MSGDIFRSAQPLVSAGMLGAAAYLWTGRRLSLRAPSSAVRAGEARL